MKLTFLGTCAGEGYPAIWCQCENCTYAREHGGKNHREYSSAVIDGDVLLDLGMTTFPQAMCFGLDISRVTTLLVTHAHEDHYVPMHIYWGRDNCSVPGNLKRDVADRMAAACCDAPPPLRMMGSRHVLDTIRHIDGEDTPEGWHSDRLGLDFVLPREGEETEMGEDLTVTPLRAIHGPARDYTYNYIIRRGGKTLLYALDTGGYDEDMWEVIRRYRYDCIVLEGTAGLGVHAPNPQHMNTDKLREFFAVFRREGLLAEGAQCILSHMAPHWTPPHDIYAPMMEKEGITVAYDGMTVEI